MADNSTAFLRSLNKNVISMKKSPHGTKVLALSPARAPRSGLLQAYLDCPGLLGQKKSMDTIHSLTINQSRAIK